MYKLYRDFSRLLNELDQFSNQNGKTWSKKDCCQPKVNLYKKENTLLLTAKLPGLSEEQLELALEKRNLTLKGEYAPSKDAEDKKTFERHLRLPFEVNSETAEAKLENGVLTLTMHQVEEQQAKKITINHSK